MREQVFIDTSAFYALADIADDHHEAARLAYVALLKQQVQFVLTEHILAESATLLRRRLGYETAREFIKTIEVGQGAGLFIIEFSNRERIRRAINIFLEFQDSKLSLVDALSFSVMSELGITRCLAFDEHFRQAGFEPLG